MLLFGVDLGFIADSPYELHSKLIVLNDISKRLGLVVNFDKSKIVGFRNGGHLSKHDKWFIGNSNLNVVPWNFFTTKLSTTCMQKNLATRAKTALLKVDRALRQLPNASIDIFQKIFDSRIATIL